MVFPRFPITRKTRELRTRIRRRLNLDVDRGILGDDSNALVYVTGQPGYLWFRKRRGGGSYDHASAVKLSPNANVPILVGQPVKAGRDSENEYVILEADSTAMIEQGQDPRTTNPNDPTRQYISQSGIITGLCTPNNPPDMQVWMQPWIFFRNRRVYHFNGALVDLDTLQPAAGEHLVAGVFLKRDLATEVKISTAKSQLYALTIEEDVQECLGQASPGSTAVWFWRLDGATTSVTAANSFLDGRQFINVGVGDADTLYAQLTTTDNTTTTIDSILLDELSAAVITGTYAAVLNDYTVMVGGTFRYTVARAAASNIVEVAAATITVDENLGGTPPALSLDVDTTTQTARIRATGITAETWKWSIQYQIHVL